MDHTLNYTIPPLPRILRSPKSVRICALSPRVCWECLGGHHLKPVQRVRPPHPHLHPEFVYNLPYILPCRKIRRCHRFHQRNWAGHIACAAAGAFELYVCGKVPDESGVVGQHRAGREFGRGGCAAADADCDFFVVGGDAKRRLGMTQRGRGDNPLPARSTRSQALMFGNFRGMRYNWQSFPLLFPRRIPPWPSPL